MLDVDDLRTCGLSAEASPCARRGRAPLPEVPRRLRACIPNLSLEGEFLAAVKACGPGAVLSHFSAAVLHGWFDWDWRFPEVTATNPRTHKGIYTHRSKNIERVFLKGIPVTPPARTLIDLSATLPFAGCAERSTRRSTAGNQARASSSRSKHRGATKLREILATAAPTRNEYEDIVLAVLLQGGLPMPDVNSARRATSPTSAGPSTA